MFHYVGSLVARFWYIVIAFWGLALAGGYLYAPRWDEVTEVGEVASLPEHVPSVRASELFRQAFPLDYAPSSVVLVFWRENAQLQDADRKFIEQDLTAGLGQLAGQDDGGINTVRTLADPQVGPLLVSGDRQATIVLVELATAFQDPRTNPIVDRIEALVARLGPTMPEGLHAAVTGSATAGRDLQRAEAASVRVIEVATIVIVIALLLLLYRAPLVALIPLTTVFVAVGVAIPLLTTLAAAGWLSMFRDLHVFVTVVAYGSGVDYCVFLIARYREELEAGASPEDAVANAVGNVSSAIAASAGTTIGGLGMLAFAQFAKIHQAGLIIPFVLTIVMLAVPTLGAAVLRVFGRWAFWPRKLSDYADAPPTDADVNGGRDLWGRLASLLLRTPGRIWVGAVLAMAPFAFVAVHYRNNVNFNPLSDLPADSPTVLGTRALEKHFPAGVLGHVTVLVQDPRLDFNSARGLAAIDRLTQGLIRRGAELELADVRSIALPLGTTAGGKERIARISGTPEEVAKVVREEAGPYYVGQEGVTRLELTLNTNPLTRDGIDSLTRIQAELPALLPPELADSRIDVAGTTASLSDLSDVKAADERLVQILVPIVVFLLLFALLRRVVASAYLIISVLFNYFATLGLTYLVFRFLEGPDFVGLDWKVTIFLFTILVAIGVDYNIFLLSRIQEEQQRHGPLAAIPVAMRHTGRVITSCGFIMAGTFASLLTGSLRALQELGFALALGITVDTMVVRPFLVPAFLVLLQRLIPGRWGRYMALGAREPAVTAYRIESPDGDWRLGQEPAQDKVADRRS